MTECRSLAVAVDAEPSGTSLLEKRFLVDDLAHHSHVSGSAAESPFDRFWVSPFPGNPARALLWIRSKMVPPTKRR